MPQQVCAPPVGKRARAAGGRPGRVELVHAVQLVDVATHIVRDQLLKAERNRAEPLPVQVPVGDLTHVGEILRRSVGTARSRERSGLLSSSSPMSGSSSTLYGGTPPPRNP